jgi:hypothetical protein
VRVPLSGEALARGAMLAAALMMAHQVAGKAARDAFFLSRFGPQALPVMVAAAALAAIALGVLSSRMLRTIPPARLIPVTLAASGVLHTAEWGLRFHQPGPSAVLVYLHVASLGSVLLSGFWSLLNERLDPYTAKKSFSRIAGAGTVGGLAGGLAAERIAALFSANSVLLYLAVAHAAAAWALRRIAAPQPLRVSPEAAQQRVKPAEALSGTPYLVSLAVLVLISTSSATLVDFVFKSYASATFSRGDSLVRFFALFYTGVSVLSVLVQTVLARRVLEKAGLARTAAALPIGVASGGVAAVLFPGFLAVAVLRGLESLLRGTLFRSAYELFYTPVPLEQKRAAKSMIDVGADRLGDAVGAGLVQLLLVLPSDFATSAILLASAVLSGVGLLIAGRLDAGYVGALERNLLSRSVELDPSEVKDSTTRAVVTRTVSLRARGAPQSLVQQGASAEFPRTDTPRPLDPVLQRLLDLRSGNPTRVRAVLARGGPLDPVLVPQVILLLGWSEVAGAARDALKKVAPAVTGQLIDFLLDPAQDFAIRRRIPGTLSGSDSQRAVDGLVAGLADARFEVRFQCGLALDGIFERNPGLFVDRGTIFTVIEKEVSVARPVWDSYRLLDRHEPGEQLLDEMLRERAHRRLEHVFSLLALVLPRDPLRIAFRALHTDDPLLRGTALEYLDNVLPHETRARLWTLIEERPPGQEQRRPAEEVLEQLLQSNQTIVLRLREMQERARKDAG